MRGRRSADHGATLPGPPGIHGSSTHTGLNADGPLRLWPQPPWSRPIPPLPSSNRRSAHAPRPSVSSASVTSACRCCARSSRPGSPVVGYDIDQEKIDMLQRGESATSSTSATDFVQEMAKSPKFLATADASSPRQSRRDHPVRADAARPPRRAGHELHRQVDGDGGEGAAQGASSSRSSRRRIRARHAATACRSSTKTGLKARRQDYFMAFSPEREDPGRKDHSTQTIPKLVGGIDEDQRQASRRCSTRRRSRR
jgi:hypothetical protein